MERRAPTPPPPALSLRAGGPPNIFCLLSRVFKLSLAHPEVFQSEVDQQRSRLSSRAGSEGNRARGSLTREQGQGGQRGGRMGRKTFSLQASQFLGSTTCYSKQVGKSNFICLFLPLKKSMQPSGRLSCLLGCKLPTWTQFTALLGDERRGCHRALQQKQRSIYLQVF